MTKNISTHLPQAAPHLPQSQTVRLLRTLTKSQIGELEEFARSFFVRGSRELLALLAFLKNAHPEFSDKKLTEAQVHRAVFAPYAFSKEKLNRLLSELNRIIGQYVALQSLQKDEAEVNFYLLKHLSNHPGEAVFEDIVRKTRAAVEVAPEGFQKMYNQFRLTQLALVRKANGCEMISPAEIWAAELTFEHFTQTQKLLLQTDRLLRNREITEAVTRAPKPPVFARLMRLVHRLCTDPASDERMLQRVFKAFKAVQARLAPAEREDVYLLLLNFCNLRFKAGSTAFGEKIGQLQVWANANPVLTRSREASDKFFLNMAISVGMLGDLKQMEAVIASSRQHLPETRRTEAEELAWAFYHYFDGSPEKVVTSLDKLHDKRPYYKARAHSLAIRAHFEIARKTEDFRRLELEIESYGKYFQRKDLIALGRRENYLQLWRWVKAFLPIAKRNQKIPDAQRQQLLTTLRAEKLQPIGADWLERIIQTL